MFFTKKVKKLVLNNFHNCQITLINEDLNPKSLSKCLSSSKIKVVKRGDTVFIYNTFLPLEQKDEPILNLSLNIAEIENVTIKNSDAYIFNSGDVNLLEPIFNFEDSKIVFDKMFKKKLDLNLSNSEVSIYGGSFILLANFKVLKNSTIIMDDIYIDELDVSLSDRNDNFDKSNIETYKNSFIRKAHLKVASKSRAVLNVLQSTKIDNISFEEIVLKGESYITGHNYTYSKNDAILTPLKVNNTMGLNVVPLYFLKNYSLPTPNSVFASFELSKKSSLLNLPEEIKKDLNNGIRERLERELKEKNINIEFAIDKENNEKILSKNQKNTDLVQMEAEAAFYRSQGIAPKKQKIANWNTDKNIDFNKLFKILNMSDLTDAITIENKSYIVNSIKRTIKENTKLNKRQQENRKKLCYLYGIKELRLEVEF